MHTKIQVQKIANFFTTRVDTILAEKFNNFYVSISNLLHRCFTIWR